MSELPYQSTTFSAARKEAIQRDGEECVFCGLTRTQHQEQPQTDEDLHDRDREVLNLLDVDLYALDTTKHGHPNHPLYQPKDADPEVYDP